MDFKEKQINDQLEVLDNLTVELLRLVNQFVKEVVPVQYVNWDSLQWSTTGPHGLFEEFKRAGAWGDSITSRMLDFEQEKNAIACAFNNLKAQVDESVEKTLKANGKQWIMSGYAYQERNAFARIEVGEIVSTVAITARRLEDISGMLGILKAKAAQLTAFKSDARVASALMSFGNQLGELK